MKKTLNITNGDCAVNIMQQANIEGDFLPWRDVLHDGPVPSGLSLEKLSQVRAKFISDCGWGRLEDIQKSFKERDETLKNYQSYDNVVLWFEHDLYDQLQLIQLLDWFYQQNDANLVLSLICTDQYLGQLSAQAMSLMPQHEIPIHKEHLTLSNRAWQALCSNTPQPWVDLLHTDLSPLPFLKDSVIRLLEEYPSTFNGLSRTAMQALSIIAAGEKNAIKIFEANQLKEAQIYLGDSSFIIIINEMLQASPALLKLEGSKDFTSLMTKGQQLSITDTGKKVLKGESNFLEIININRSIGGVHLTQQNNWSWDTKALKIVHKVS